MSARVAELSPAMWASGGWALRSAASEECTGPAPDPAAGGSCRPSAVAISTAISWISDRSVSV